MKQFVVGDVMGISIHALLAESDPPKTFQAAQLMISIHALLAESDNSAYGALDGASISIHALLAESDRKVPILGIK